MSRVAVEGEPKRMEEKILTQHPQGKQGVRISRAKYDAVRQAILDALAVQEPISYRDLGDAVAQHLEGSFEGSLGWYYTTVKLDLEARNEIERVPGARPQQLRRASGGAKQDD